MPITEDHELPEINPSTAHQETTASSCATGSAQADEPSAEALANQAEGQDTPSAETSDSGEGRRANSEQRPANGEPRTANGEQRSPGVKLCRHIMEDGVYCQIPALSGRPYCYRHLRLRGQQMRIARALAQRQSFQLLLPPLEDLNAVQSALIHVTAALAARLLDRHHAGQLLYALQQTASNLRFLAKTQAKAAAASIAPQAAHPAAPATLGAPPFSPSVGERVGDERVVEEYPEFEAEFGLPAGLDLTLPPQMAFPLPDQASAPTPTGIHPLGRWTKEAIALEELDDRRSQMDEKSYSKQAHKLNDKLRQRADTHIRQQREAEWEAEAARRNAREDEKVRRWHSMDAAQQRAFMEGVMSGREEEAAEQREKARQKKPVASLEREPSIVGMGELPEREDAK